MQKEWFTLAELAAARLPGLPNSHSSLKRLAGERGWRSVAGGARKVAAKTKQQWEYHYSLLPSAAQTRLLIVHSEPGANTADAAIRNGLWLRFEALSKEHKETCENRLRILVHADNLTRSGMAVNAAVTLAAARHDVSVRVIYNWQGLIQGIDREDWLAALAPSFSSTSERDPCHPDAWEFLTSDFLRPEEPSFSSCYRRLTEAACKEKWAPIPSERSLRRRLNAEVPEAVQTLARKGKDKAKTLYPAQRRTRDHLHAMQAVNMDGHKLDVFVRLDDDRIVRLYLLAIQDLYSGKILAWRLTDSENKETVRLVIGDMVEAHGIPEIITLDNGRAFASKWISGGSVNRYRFKVREEEPEGLLTALGVELSWTLPYSGQSKPIERAWRDIADDIARHPICAGAYTGNKPDAKPENYASRAVPIDTMRAHVAKQIEEHNRRSGRTATICAGRSFDETFAAGLEHAIVRRPTAAQRALWLLAAERIRAQRGSGEIHLFGNRYWSRELNAHAGRYVTVRFDPDHLTKPLRVYDQANVLICEAECIVDAGFHDAEAARLHAKARNDYQKALAAEKRAHARLSAEDLAAILTRGDLEAPKRPQPTPRITRLVTGNLAVQAARAEQVAEQADFERHFSRALHLISGGATIHQFPADASVGNEPVSAEYGSEKNGRE
ncbi:MAG TPA: transposase domain-containing protein [Mesorhizobium sp.]|jgi:transposase InsO family protein|uniref:transposase domain-containing protein n=1 Tax=Mesorhizobium sp. TaxID=1871066 RepID=UPI002DDCE2C5|nr:transposase domain-containing protein [Mesorhizobium sp.]HEV2501639.1 transposase domain-containing protein [Mesorhizobium sp.]